ncbi:hypothetical protein Tco_0267979 [Tanacetum coccineum]
MSTYLKNMAGYKHSQLKSKSYDEIQKLFDKEMKRVNTFMDMNSEAVKGSETRTEERSKKVLALPVSRVSSSSGGSHCQAFARRNRGGSGIGSSLWGDMDLPVPFVPAWNLTTHSILNDAESCRDMMINLATPAV